MVVLRDASVQREEEAANGQLGQARRRRLAGGVGEPRASCRPSLPTYLSTCSAAAANRAGVSPSAISDRHSRTRSAGLRHSTTRMAPGKPGSAPVRRRERPAPQA